MTSEDNDEHGGILKSYKSADQPPLSLKPMTLSNLKSLESRDRLDDHSDSRPAKRSGNDFSKAKDGQQLRSRLEVDDGSTTNPGFLSPFAYSNKAIPEVDEVPKPQTPNPKPLFSRES